MPELDGMAFLEAVRQRYPDSSVIMLSGMSETTTAVDCLHLGRGRLPAQADLAERAAGPGESGAGEAGAGAAEPVLPAASRAAGPGAGPADPGAVSPGRADAGPGARGQGRLHPGTLDPGESVRRRHRAAAGLRRARAWTASGWEGSCTTSGRSGPARQCCTSPASLTAEEFRQITEHPALGERMLLTPGARVARCAPDRALASRAAGRPRLSRRSARREDPDRGAHRGGRRLRSTP